jgi:hypothetical protein
LVPVDQGRCCLGSTHNSYAQEVELENTSSRVGSASRNRWYFIFAQRRQVVLSRQTRCHCARTGIVESVLQVLSECCREIDATNRLLMACLVVSQGDRKTCWLLLCLGGAPNTPWAAEHPIVRDEAGV